MAGRTHLVNAVDVELAAQLNPADTSITLAAGQGDKMPTLPFYFTVDPLSVNREYVLVAERTGDVLSGLTRDLDGTGNTTHSVGSLCRIDFTKQAHDDLWNQELQVFNVLAFGAVGDGVTDDTAAIQAAIDAAEAAGGGTVMFPQVSTSGTTTYLTGPITAEKAGVRLVGPGFQAVKLLCTSGDLLTVGAAGSFANDFELVGLHLQVNSGGGHVVKYDGAGAARGYLGHSRLTQLEATKSAITAGDGVTFQDTLMEHLFITGSASNTASLLSFVSSTGTHNQNTLRDSRIDDCGEYMIHIENTSVATPTKGWNIDSINFEESNAGAIKLMGVRDSVLSNLKFYDLGTITQHLILLDEGTGGVDSINVTLQNLTKYGGTLDTGIHHLKTDGSFTTLGHTIINVHGSSAGSPWSFDFNGKQVVLINSGLYASYTNDGNAFKILSKGMNAWTPTNVTTTRSFDADTVTLAELADVVGTLIEDDQTTGMRQ